jgi:tRNA 2-thiocytidine biosynthesis protein TtcA
MHDYSMLGHGDRVLVAVSGGIDSSVLAWILRHWLNKAPLEYTLKAVFIDNGFWQEESGGSPPAVRITEMMQRLAVDFSVVKGREIPEEKRTCYLCAGNRRSQLFDLAKEWRMNKIAMGHHRDDLVETLFLNMLYSGNISTMLPKQSLFGGELDIIRPMAYLGKDEVRVLAVRAGIEPVKNFCPLEKDTKRETVRDLLAVISAKIPGARKSLFQSMANIRDDYML